MKWLILCCLFTIAFGASCGTCDVDDDCDSSYGEVCCNGNCVGLLPVGSACGSNVCGSCFDYCVNGVCTEYDTGCSCTNDTGCGSEPNLSFCLAGSCVPAYQTFIDGACRDSRECEQGLYCIGSTCQGNQTLNQSCTVDSEGRSNCASAYYCIYSSRNGGVCVQKIPNGEACSTSSQCVDGSGCKQNGNSLECGPLTANGGNCSDPSECLSMTCRLSTHTCVAAGTLVTGEICDSDLACQSGVCTYGPRNGTTDLNRYCWAPNRTLANGEFCYAYADNCIGVCQCATTRCTTFDAATKCVTPKSIPDGSPCITSLACQNMCVNGVCVSSQSVADGGACVVDEQCMGGSRCTDGLCTSTALGSRCNDDVDCSLNQECICNGTRGTCQSTFSSRLNYMENQSFRKKCADVQDEIAGYFYCLSYNNPLNAPLICQTLYAKSMCCQNCILVNASLTISNLSSIFPSYGSEVPALSIDCATFTLTSTKNQCCGTSNSTCGYRKQVNLTKNCPNIASSITSSSMSTSASMTVSDTWTTFSSETAVRSDADGMRLGWAFAVAILLLA